MGGKSEAHAEREGQQDRIRRLEPSVYILLTSKVPYNYAERVEKVLCQWCIRDK